MSNIRNNQCTLCGLCEDVTTVCLMGEGSITSPIMVVGVSPSLTDDQCGRPIQGRPGKLLANIFDGHGYKREDIYYTTVVKCKTPDSRDPEKGEWQACLHYLRQEIEAIKPKVIITLGNVALTAVTGKSGITNYRGKELVGIEGIMTIPTFAPAAVLRSPKYMNQFKADIYKAVTFARGTNSQKYNPSIRYVMNKESLRDLIRHLENASKIELNYGALDLETTTFDYWRPETKVMTMGICVDDEVCWGIPLEHAMSPWRGQSQKLLEYLRPYFMPGKFKTWVGNNWKYDLKWMRKKYNIDVDFGPDNMLISYANDENSPHGLKYQAALHCDAPDYAKDITWPAWNPTIHDIKDVIAKYNMINLMKLLKYNALDAFYSRHVYPKEKEILLKDVRTARIYKHLLEKGSKVFTYIEENGMWVDPGRLEVAFRECNAKIDELKGQLNGMIPEGWCENHLSKKQLKEGFNWNSTKQLGELFFGEDGFQFPILLKTATGKPSTSESVLIELNAEVDHPALNGLMEYRKWAKYMSTYLVPWNAKLDENSRLHPTYKLHGTVTGRMSGEDGVHQVPRDKFIRGLIGAPPGWSFFEIDGSQIELRVAAAISGESTMLRVYALGGDIHRETAAVVMGISPEEVTGADRKKAKAVNFGFLYGMGWKKFKIYAWEKYGIRLTDAEARQFRERFFQKYKDLPQWHTRMRKLVRAIGYVISPIGRKRRLPDIYSVDEGMQAAAEREAINSPVQGFGSDYVLAAFIEMVLEIIMKEDPNFETIKPVGAVHDAQYYEIRNDMVPYWAPKIKQCFDDATRLQKWFGYTPPLAITGDCKIGNHWGDAKDWEPGQPFPHEMR